MDSNFEKVSNKNKKTGLVWIIAPLLGLPAVLIIYALMIFVASTMSASGNDMASGVLVFKAIKIILGILGVLDVIMIPVGFVLGIKYLNKKETVIGVTYDERSGKKEASIIPAEIKGWNWGAAGLTWIWGSWHGVWLSFLAFIPGVNIIMIFVLGVKGSEWAWSARQWESVESFKAAQEKWKISGIVFFVFSMMSLISRVTR